MHRRFIGLALVLTGSLFLAVGCNPDGIDPEADVNIVGTLQNADGTPAADYLVAWVKNDIGQEDLTGLFTDFGDDTFDDIGNNADRFEFVVTGADGSFEIKFKGVDANTKASETAEPGEEEAAYHQILVLQIPLNGADAQTFDGFPVILSRNAHSFTTDSGYTWNVGDIKLWNDNYATPDTGNDEIDLDWDALSGMDGAYFLKLRDSSLHDAWEANVEGLALSLPVEAIHPSRATGVGYFMIGQTDMWVYRTDDVLIDLSGLTRLSSDVMATNDSYALFTELSDGQAGTPLDQICETATIGELELADNDLGSRCTITDVSASVVGLAYDFFDNNQPAGALLVDVSEVVIFDAYISSWSNSCIQVWVYPNIEDDWTQSLLTDPARHMAAEACGVGILGDEWVALPLDNVYSTRHMQILLDNPAATLNSVAEIGVYAP